MNFTFVKEAATVHKDVVASVRQLIKPGIKVIDICKHIEAKIASCFKGDIFDYECGIAFPVGVSINNVAAHDSAWSNEDNRTIDIDDIVKIDFGVHVHGHLVDSAFTLAWNPCHFNLMRASKEALDAAIKIAGSDVRLCDVSEAIVEVVDSFDGIKPVANIGGHNILPYKVHGGKFIPCCKTNDNTKMKEGEVYAIEVFTTKTTKKGVARMNLSAPFTHFSLDTKTIKQVDQRLIRRRTLPFSNRWYDISEIESLCTKYPPLICDGPVAQFEHTLLIGDKVEVVTRNDFY